MRQLTEFGKKARQFDKMMAKLDVELDRKKAEFAKNNESKKSKKKKD